jgi:hypothetical protein
MSIPRLPIELWQNILELLDIQEAIATSKAHPRFFGAFIESKQVIRFRSAINSFVHSNAVDLPVGPLSSFVCSVLRDSSLDFSNLILWLKRRFRPSLSSSIAVNRNPFKDLSAIITSKDRGFVCVSSILSNWTVEMKAKDDTTCSISWIIIYRASVSGYRAVDFHQACEGMGKCVVIVKAENVRIAPLITLHIPPNQSPNE